MDKVKNNKTVKEKMEQEHLILLGFASLDLANLKKALQEIAGEWNGEDYGEKEYRYDIALNVISKIQEIEELLKNL